MASKKIPMTLENKWDIIYVSFVVIGLIGLILLWNGTFIWFLMTLFLPLIIWIYRGNWFLITIDWTLDRLKNFKKYQTKIIYTIVLFIILFIFTIKASIPFISAWIKEYQHNRILEIQQQQARVEKIEKENTPQIKIQMITDLNWIVKWTWITLEYIVDNASWVYFNGNLVSPSSGVNYFKQEVALSTPNITVDIKGQNKYWFDVQQFTIKRDMTDQEIQTAKEAEQVRIQKEKLAEETRIQAEKDAEKARIAEEKYKNSPAYKNQLLQDRVDKLNSNDWRDESTTLQVWCQQTLKNTLKSPKSADFPWGYWDFKVKAWKIVADSYVDAQNSFWAQLRMYFECIFELDWEIVSLVDIKELQ